MAEGKYLKELQEKKEITERLNQELKKLMQEPNFRVYLYAKVRNMIKEVLKKMNKRVYTPCSYNVWAKGEVATCLWHVYINNNLYHIILVVKNFEDVMYIELK